MSLNDFEPKAPQRRFVWSPAWIAVAVAAAAVVVWLIVRNGNF